MRKTIFMRVDFIRIFPVFVSCMHPRIQVRVVDQLELVGDIIDLSVRSSAPLAANFPLPLTISLPSESLLPESSLP